MGSLSFGFISSFGSAYYIWRNQFFIINIAEKKSRGKFYQSCDSSLEIGSKFNE